MGCATRKKTVTQPFGTVFHLANKPKKSPDMKSYLKIISLLVLPLALFSCRDKIEETYTVNEPVYMTYDDLRNSFKVAGGQEIVQPGKIYFKDNYIFVNEYQKGIHIVDNTNPESPEVIRFIEIPGNVDIAIRESILYADSFIDLLAIDISDLNNIREVKRIEGVFQYMIPACEDGIVENVDETRGVIVGYTATERTVSVDEIGERFREFPTWRNDLIFMAAFSSDAAGTNNGGSGTGGSMARFTVYDRFLYTVDNYNLRLFDITTAADPVLKSELYVGWNIETLFPYDQKLFLGSTTGMYIYSLADPANPAYISMFRHASSCDPVVVQGDYAYVTLRAGNLCGDITSQLDVIDISDIQTPYLVKEYTMEEPYGVGIDGELLFVCDGDAGLKIFNASDPRVIDQNKIAEYENINAFDVIPLGEVLILIGTDGLYQYDYSDPENIHALSVIPIVDLQHAFE
jgi:hypothetical protein